MADETIGVARIDITGDASGIDAATAKAKASIASMSKEAQSEYARLSSAEKRRIDSLIRQADTVGMTRAQQLAYNASLKSSGAVLDDITARLKLNAAATKSVGVEFNKYGISAKQELAALRQVPAQITDIIVSLQGGQRPLTVLLQQGGQLRDIFGGATPALKAMGGALLGMVNPATLALGALAALAYGYFQGAKEAEEFQKTLIMTNDAIGVSVDGLQTLAGQIDRVSGTHANAARVLNMFAKDATVLAANLKDYAQIAVEWADATGQGVEDVVNQFSELAKDPLKASEKLNESMRFLTAGIYDQIRALVDAGRETEAANVAQKAYADALKDRTPQMVANLGYVERAWRAIKNVGAEAVDSVLSIGRAQTAIDKLAQMKRDFDRNFGPNDDQNAFRGLWGGRSARAAAAQAIADQEQIVRMQAASARQQADIRRQEQRNLELARGRADFLHSGRTKTQQKDDDVAAENRKWKDLSEGLEKGSKQYEALYAAHRENLRQIDEKYRDKSGGPKNDAATRMLMSLREQEASLRAQADSSEKLTSQQSALAKFEQQIADIKNKQTLTADEKSILAAQDKIRAQLQINVAVEREAEAKKAIIALEQRSAQINEQMAASRDLANERYQRLLDSFGLGDKAMQRAQEEGSIFKEFRKRQDSLAKGLSPEALQSDAYKKESAKIEAELQRRLMGQKSFYEEVDKLQKSWALGASHGMANYADDAMNAFENVGSFATKTFQEMEDALTEFFMTGKFNATDFVNYVTRELVRLSVQQGITGPLAGAMGSGGLGSLLGSVVGGLTSMLGGGATAAAEAAGNVAGSFGGDAIGAMLKFLPSAKGNVFDSPSLSRYSSQIHDTPKLFTFARGAGVFGEAGPEAIMPLKRGPDGRLGVQTHSPGGSNGSSGGRIIVTVPITINTPDANSFRKSQGQIAREMGLAANRAIARN